MTNDELKALEAESDYWASAARQQAAPLYNQEAMDHAKATAWRDGQNHVFAFFDPPKFVPGHLPEEYTLGNTDGPHFKINRLWEEADPSVGIQAWDIYVVEPQGHVRAAIEEWEQLRNLEATIRQWYGKEMAFETMIEKHRDILTELDAIRERRERTR